MNNQELFKLVRDSKLAQVATPLSKKLRLGNKIPTHQIIYTPKSSAIRSNYGIKTHLPKKVGQSHIVYNDLDNKSNMPDVEKYSGPYYNRLKFQETGMVLKNYFSESNPLFPSKSTKTINENSFGSDVISTFNLNERSSPKDVKRVLRRNPNLYKNFQKWLLDHNPQAFTNATSAVLLKNLTEFLKHGSSQEVKRKETTLKDFTRPLGKKNTQGPPVDIQGTGGFSYAQRGRLNNTPNGVKSLTIIPGRVVHDRVAAVAGFAASLNERTVILQSNYAKSYPGKHPNQFVVPMKLTEAEISPKGEVKIYADGVRAGSWIQRADVNADPSTFEPANPNFGTAKERSGRDNVTLENLMNLINH